MAVLDDVLDGNVSLEKARTEYGVVISSTQPPSLDLPATAKLRASKI
jgi:hypothetical protein